MLTYSNRSLTSKLGLGAAFAAAGILLTILIGMMTGLTFAESARENWYLFLFDIAFGFTLPFLPHLTTASDAADDVREYRTTRRIILTYCAAMAAFLILTAVVIFNT